MVSMYAICQTIIISGMIICLTTSLYTHKKIPNGCFQMATVSKNYDQLGTSGLSRKMREIIQDNGDYGVGQEHYYVWLNRIKKRIPPTLIDAMLILKYHKSLDLKPFLNDVCKDELIAIHRLSGDLLTELGY